MIRTIACTLLIAVLPAVAAEDDVTHERHGPPRRLLEKFDANHDGRLDEGERTALRAAIAARLKKNHPAVFTELDTDGDGVLGRAEFRAGRQKLQELRKRDWEEKEAKNDHPEPTH